MWSFWKEKRNKLAQYRLRKRKGLKKNSGPDYPRGYEKSDSKTSDPDNATVIRTDSKLSISMKKVIPKIQTLILLLL